VSEDPLGLAPLFAGGGEPWLPLLAPVLESQPQAEDFIGRNRGKAIVPVRELTFQALKPNPPERWRVVIFGQNPYPRAESATGIAMFDNSFADWNDAAFGRVVSMRCIVKAACMRAHKTPRNASVADVRKLLAEKSVVKPPRWFQAMLTQGVLLLNASLSASTDGAISTAAHAKFWKPVIERIVEEILRSRGERGVVFVWWGVHAKTLRAAVETLEGKVSGVRACHVSHCNPAASGEAFCDGDPFGAIDTALATLGMEPIDWLPTAGWDQKRDKEEADRFGEFIETTRELHKLYLDRLQDVASETLTELPPIDGVMALPPPTFAEAMAPIVKLLPSIAAHVERARDFAGRRRAVAAALSEHEIAALHIYTMQSAFYRRLNATLRDPDRASSIPWRGYLRLFLSATSKLRAGSGQPVSLFRGVCRDLHREYAAASAVTWWGVSSCTPSAAVAQGFLGATGGRTLFELTARSAVSIRKLSAFTGEDEYVLAPGTRLEVVEVTDSGKGLHRVSLRESTRDAWGNETVATSGAGLQAPEEPGVEPNTSQVPVPPPIGPAAFPSPGPPLGRFLLLGAAVLALAGLIWGLVR
jgi:uracil DNA glycosylase